MFSETGLYGSYKILRLKIFSETEICFPTGFLPRPILQYTLTDASDLQGIRRLSTPLLLWIGCVYIRLCMVRLLNKCVWFCAKWI